MHLDRRAVLLAGVSLAALDSVQALAAKSTTGYYRLVQGPIVGAVGPDRLSIFTRVSAPVPITIDYGTDPALSDLKTSAPVLATRENDYVARIELTGLKPDTVYYYRVRLDGKKDRYLDDLSPFPVRTAPPAGARGRFRIGFGSCARVQAHAVQPIWDAVAGWKPDLFLWLGDNVYLDTLEPTIMAEVYHRQREVPNLMPLMRTVPQLAIWDDHDFGLNNTDRTNPGAADATAIFKRYWPNPSFGTPEVPGIFFRFSYGDVDFFMLDDRTYRDPNDDPDGPAKTMLGAGQLDWLKRELKASRGTFKIIANGSGWTRAKGPKGDSWAAFLTERDRLFDFIFKEKITGVVLISGDTHVGELNAVPGSETGGYDLYDLVSSPLAQDTADSWLNRRPERRIRQVYWKGSNFGALEIDTTAQDPTLSFTVIDPRGVAAWRPLLLRASELRNGVRSWDAKMDEPSRLRYEQAAAGRDYYHHDPSRETD